MTGHTEDVQGTLPNVPAHGGKPTVSIVTVTWNSATVVRAFLESVTHATDPLSYELIVVDNGSSDATVDLIRRMSPDATVIANATNRGLAAANNQGLSRCRGDFITICNPDVIFRRGAVVEMIEALRRHPSAGWVVPRQRHEDGRLLTTAGNVPRLYQALLGRVAAGWLSRGTTHGLWWDGWPHDEERPIGRGQEAVYTIRREALEQVGPQDERFVLDWEGPDWTDRFHDAGWEIWLAPLAEVVHLGGVSVKQARLRWIISTHRGMYYYFSGRARRWERPFLAAVIAIRAVLKVAGTFGGLPFYRLAHRAGTSEPGGAGDPSADRH